MRLKATLQTEKHTHLDGYRYIGDETPHADADADAETIGCAFYDSNTETSVTPEKRVVPCIHLSEPTS